MPRNRLRTKLLTKTALTMMRMSVFIGHLHVLVFACTSPDLAAYRADGENPRKSVLYSPGEINIKLVIDAARLRADADSI